jgi:DNA-binding transcriptional LysR family regulator
MNATLDLSDMAIFARVVAEASFTHAARALDLPKSTVSRRVAQLEERLGVRLLQRTTRAVKLTELGAAYYERCARIVAEAEEAHEAVASAGATPQGLLRLTAPVGFGATFLGEIVADFLEAHPQVSAEVVLTDRRVDLVEEGFDLAIRIGTRIPETSFFARRLGPARLLMCASPAYLARCGTPEVPEDLRRHDCIVHGEGPRASTWTLHGPSGAVPISVSGRLRVNSIPLAHKGALAGLGIAVLPTVVALPDLHAGRLHAVLDGWNPSAASIYAVYPTSRHLSAKVRSFLDFLVQRITTALREIDGPSRA